MLLCRRGGTLVYIHIGREVRPGISPRRIACDQVLAAIRQRIAKNGAVHAFYRIVGNASGQQSRSDVLFLLCTEAMQA